MATKREQFYQNFSDFLNKHYSEFTINKILDDEIIEQFDIETLKDIIIGMYGGYYPNKFNNSFQTDDIDFKKLYKVLEAMNNLLYSYSSDNHSLVYNTLAKCNDDHLNVIYSFYDNYLTEENISNIEKGMAPKSYKYLLRYLLDRDILSLNFLFYNEDKTQLVTLKNVDQVIEMYQNKEDTAVDCIKNRQQGNFSLEKFKDAYLYLNYGLTLAQADYLRSYYGQFLDYLEVYIDDYNRDLFETLKSISFIVKHDNFSSEDIEDMASTTLWNYKNQLNNEPVPFVVLSSYFKQMYLDIYNKSFLNISDINQLPKQEGLVPSYVKDIGGVPIIDAGVDFLLCVHSIERKSLSDSFGDDVDEDRLRFSSQFKEDWKKIYKYEQKGFSTSIIGPSNMGTLCNDTYLLGFSNYQQQNLITMSQGDAYTSRNSVILYRNDLKQKRLTNYFIPPNKIEDESRYGYNEAFFSDSKMPDYLVAFTKADSLDERSSIVAAAKSLGCPVVCIDRQKVKQNEINKITAMENMLFSENNLNSSLIFDILCRYMNLYTSSIVSAHDFNARNPQYQMIDEIKNFIFRIDNKINAIDDNDIKIMWLSELEMAYNDELRKFKVAQSIEPYYNSISTFILNDERYIDLYNYICTKKAEIFSAINSDSRKR